MKFLLIFALAWIAVSAFDLRKAVIDPHNVVVPVVETDGLIPNIPVAATVEEEVLTSADIISENEDAAGLFFNASVHNEVLTANDDLRENVNGDDEDAYAAKDQEFIPHDPVAAPGGYEELTANIAVPENEVDQELLENVPVTENINSDSNIPVIVALQNKELTDNLTTIEDVDDSYKLITNNTVLNAVESEGRITRGHYAREGQFPYQAFLQIYNGGHLFCGGSLIGRNWVLSAAHCTVGARRVTVHLGSVTSYRGYVRHTVYSNSIINHSGYGGSGLINDISLIKIPTVTYSSRIQPIRLPSMSSNSYAGYTAIASGWGQTESGRVSSYLKWARMPVISNSQCRRTFGFLPSTNVCVSTYGGISICFGDSGGPLVVEPMTLIGVTSFVATRNCLRGDPAGFTRVTSYLSWIRQHTGIYY